MVHDVVVVGGGTAGCILAARLSEDPQRSVLLLEAGPDFVGAEEYPPALRDELVYPWDYMWDYDALPTELEDRRIVAFRGRAIGGSSSVNGSFYMRGAPEDYDSWGSPLWANDALLPAFARIERDLDFPDGGRRAAGALPLRRVPQESWPASQLAVYRAAVGLGHREVEDVLPNLQDGVGPIPRNSVDGVRVNAALAFLDPVRSRPNLTVRGETVVTRILIEDGVAVGVEVLDAGQRSSVYGKEIVLASGSIGSPHLLTLSGIGPAEVLERLGIPAVAERDGVGRNLSDHGLLAVIARLREGAEVGEPRNLVALRSTAAGSDSAGDIFLTAVSGDLVDGTESDDDRGHVPDCYLSIYCMLNLPESRGELEIVSADAADLPRVHYRYLGSARDRDRLRQVVRLAVQILDAPELSALVSERIVPTTGQLESDSELDAWIASMIATGFHGAGTCKLGSADDPTAVVDDHGRVFGVKALRVADLSIAPTVLRAPTNATAMVIAERIAELVAQEQLATEPA